MRRRKSRVSAQRVESRTVSHFSLVDTERLIQRPQVRVANKRLRKVFEAITGWNMIAKGGVPKKAFKLAVEYEDALGRLNEALIAATADWLLGRTRPLREAPSKQTKHEEV